KRYTGYREDEARAWRVAPPIHNPFNTVRGHPARGRLSPGRLSSPPSGGSTMRRLLMATLAALLLAAGVWGPVGQAAQGKAVKVLIITGDHGHNWRQTTPFLKELLQNAGHRVDVTETPGKDLTPENLARYDVLLLNYRNTPKGAKENPDSVWTDANKKAFTEAV